MSFSSTRAPSVLLQRNRNESVSHLKKDPHLETKGIIRDFLRRSGYKPHATPPNAQLRAAIIERMVSWESDDHVATLEKVVDTACTFIETAYQHTSPEHAYYIALYKAITVYIDDLGDKHLDALRQFVARFARGEKQLSPALDTYVDLLRGAHQLWPEFAADEIIATTLDDVSSMCIERTTQDMNIKPDATLFPDYLRTRTGFARPFAHFVFGTKSWRASTESYLQVMPYMERWICAANDILSFYKEQLAGETNNYMHMRAITEQTTATNVLRKLCEETLEWDRQILALSSGDSEITDIWQKYVQGYLEFHCNNHRYRLSELGFSAIVAENPSL